MSEASRPPRGPRNVVKARYISPKKAKAAGAQCIQVGEDYITAADVSSSSAAVGLPRAKEKQSSPTGTIIAEAESSSMNRSKKHTERDHSPMVEEDIPVAQVLIPDDNSSTSSSRASSAALPDSSDFMEVTSEPDGISIANSDDPLSSASEMRMRQGALSRYVGVPVVHENEKVKCTLRPVVCAEDDLERILPSGEIESILGWRKMPDGRIKYLVSIDDPVTKNIFVWRDFFNRRHSYKQKLLEFYQELWQQKEGTDQFLASPHGAHQGDQCQSDV